MRYISVASAITLYTCFVASSASAQTSRARATPSSVRAQVVQVQAPYVVRESFREPRCADITCPNFILIGVGF